MHCKCLEVGAVRRVLKEILDAPFFASRGPASTPRCSDGCKTQVATLHYSLVARWLQEAGRAQEIVMEMFRLLGNSGRSATRQENVVGGQC